RGRRGSARLFSDDAERRRLGSLARAEHLEDLRLEVLEQPLALREPPLRVAPLWRVEPVPLVDALEPGAELLELHPDLFRLLVRVVGAEVLELDLLGEVHLAVLDDLEVVLRGLLAEERDDLLLLVGGEAAQRQEMEAALLLVDALEHRLQLAPDAGQV